MMLSYPDKQDLFLNPAGVRNSAFLDGRLHAETQDRQSLEERRCGMTEEEVKELIVEHNRKQAVEFIDRVMGMVEEITAHPLPPDLDPAVWQRLGEVVMLRSKIAALQALKNWAEEGLSDEGT
jgi:hypothetical protein